MVYTDGWKKVMIIAAIAVLCPVLIPADARSAPKPREAAKTAIAEKAPDFVLTDLNGRKFRLSDFRGKQPVLIIFSATWCSFCKEEIPHFKSLHTTYAKRGLLIVNIDIQESKERVAKFTTKYGLPYRVLLDEEGIVRRRHELTIAKYVLEKWCNSILHGMNHAVFGYRPFLYQTL